jgi:hypothetical protein
MHPFIPAQSITVTEILLDFTVTRIKNFFSRYGNIVHCTMETCNLWQRATLTFDDKAKFDLLYATDGLLIINDSVRIHMCDMNRKEIQDRSKFSKKLTNLPRGTTARDLLEIGKMLDATAWIVPKARSNYNYLQHAYFYF